MANKYSKYELMPFPSLYVDNKQPEIATLLSQRYDSNKQSKDLIDRTLSQLEVLEGDKNHVERVKTDVKGILKNHIEKGDWENSSLVVADAVQKVETDSGLIAANKSMKNRQAEINAMREAKLNGIPMLDFGADSRRAHQSYYYDPTTETYVTNVYEPMMEQQLDYRTRKEAMVGKIPADQGLNWAGVGRGKTNKTANLLVEQYIADTKEGAQEYRKLVNIDLPQSLPVEERMKMARAHILNDFREVARQQEYNKVVATTDDNANSKSLGNGDIVITSSIDTPVNTGFDSMSDKIRGIQERQVALNQIIVSQNSTDDEKAAAQQELQNNQSLLNNSLRGIAMENGPKGQATLQQYDNLVEEFNKYGHDGERLLAATQYLTYNTTAGDTDWGNVLNWAATGGATAGGAAVLANVIPGAGQVAYGAAMGAGFIAGGVTGITQEMSKELRNVRDWFRPQESGFLGIDDEREELADVIWNGESRNDGAKVDKINRLLGTNFKDKDLDELMRLTDSYYTFMTKDDYVDDKGVVQKRMSGDDLFDQASSQKFTVNQKTLSFGPTSGGKKLRGNTNSFVQNELSLQNAGVTFDGMTTNSNEFKEWLNDGIGGAQNLTLQNIRLPDIATNTPLRLTFGSNKDASGDVDRTAYVTDRSVLQPGGWVYDLIDKNYGQGDKVYNEYLRQAYNEVGYDNVTMDNYLTDLSVKRQRYTGLSDEDRLAYKRVMEDETILKMLTNPKFNFDHYELNGTRGIKTQNGFIPFVTTNNMTGQQSYNQAALIALQQRPAELASLRQMMLNKSLADMSGLQF